MLDMLGKKLEVGQIVAEPIVTALYGPEINITKVREIVGKDVYVGDNKTLVSFPNKLLIITEAMNI